MRLLVAFSALAAIAAPCWAAPSVQTAVRPTTTTSTIPSQAAAHHLTDAEWSRYETLMKGPRGRWSPNLDPVNVLGIHANSDAERRRYAELAAQLTQERVEAEITFALAYQDAWTRLYGARISPASAANPHPRIALFVTEACGECDQQVSHYLSALSGHRIAGLDIYLLGTARDDDVRAWALARKIPADLVLQRQLTLNHGDAVIQTLGYPADRVPLALTRDARNQFVPLDGGLP